MPDALMAKTIPVLDEEAWNRYVQAVESIKEQIRIVTDESDALAELRDALLPKLMSGEIDVSKVDLTQLNNHLAETLRPFGCHIPATQKRGGPHPCEPPRSPILQVTATTGTTPLLPK